MKRTRVSLHCQSKPMPLPELLHAVENTSNTQSETCRTARSCLIFQTFAFGHNWPLYTWCMHRANQGLCFDPFLPSKKRDYKEILEVLIKETDYTKLDILREVDNQSMWISRSRTHASDDQKACDQKDQIEIRCAQYEDCHFQRTKLGRLKGLTASAESRTKTIA